MRCAVPGWLASLQMFTPYRTPDRRNVGKSLPAVTPGSFGCALEYRPTTRPASMMIALLKTCPSARSKAPTTSVERNAATRSHKAAIAEAATLARERIVSGSYE